MLRSRKYNKLVLAHRRINDVALRAIESETIFTVTGLVSGFAYSKHLPEFHALHTLFQEDHRV